MATDLRASVSLILAALTAKGKSIINRIYHLDRGYEEIEKNWEKLELKLKSFLNEQQKYLSKIIAKDQNGINVISACCSEAKARIDEINF